MKNSLLIFILYCLFISCNDNLSRDVNVLQYETATSPIMAGRGFIEAVLKGDFEVAKSYAAPFPMLDQVMLTQLQRPYNQLSPAVQKAFEQSSIRIDKLEGTGALRTLHYGNSARDKQRKINLILNGTEWKVIFDAQTESPF